VVCLITPEPFDAVGRWYADFAQTTDDAVRELLDRAATRSMAVGNGPERVAELEARERGAEPPAPEY